MWLSALLGLKLSPCSVFSICPFSCLPGHWVFLKLSSPLLAISLASVFLVLAQAGASKLWPPVKSSEIRQLFVLVNKVSLKHSHHHLFTYCPWLLAATTGLGQCWQGSHGPQGLKYLPPESLQKTFADHCLWSKPKAKPQKQAPLPQVITHIVFLVLVALEECDNTVVDKESQGQHARQLWEPSSYL